MTGMAPPCTMRLNTIRMVCSLRVVKIAKSLKDDEHSLNKTLQFFQSTTLIIS